MGAAECRSLKEDCWNARHYLKPVSQHRSSKSKSIPLAFTKKKEQILYIVNRLESRSQQLLLDREETVFSIEQRPSLQQRDQPVRCSCRKQKKYKKKHKPSCSCTDLVDAAYESLDDDGYEGPSRNPYLYMNIAE